jgi:HEPN domain-containing protein
MFKAVLAVRSIPYRRTHDLVELMDLLRDAGVSVPEGLDEVRRLTPFAVGFRYDELPEETGEKPLDRAWLAAAVGAVRKGTEGLIRESTSP